MSKKDLKKQYKEFNYTIFDIISKLDPTPTNKLTPFLLKEFKKSVCGEKQMRRLWWSDNLRPQNKLDLFFYRFLEECFDVENLKVLKRYSTHLSEKRIEDKDIMSYNGWSKLRAETNKADLKYLEKELSKQTLVVHEDDDWLFLKPLSFRASQTYGSGTKWCTTSKDNPSYFYNYSRDGILVYVIGKKNGNKFGFYSSEREFSVWDSKDRRIDSMETRIPLELLPILSKSLDLKNNPVNHELFSDKEIAEENKLGNFGKLRQMNEMEPVNAVLQGEYHHYEAEMEVDVTEENWTPRGADVAFEQETAPMFAPNTDMAAQDYEF